MDSVKFFKGYAYDKVSHLENQNQNPQQKVTKKPVSAAIIISAALLFTLVIGLTLTPLVLKPSREGSSSLSSNDSAESIRTICNVTRSPDSCFTALSASLNPSTKPDPETIFSLSLKLAITHLSNLSSSLKSLNDNDFHSQPALKDCAALIDDALGRLNDSVSAMKGKELVLTKEKISDIQTWVSAAMSDHETCNDGLEEIGSTVSDEVKSQFQSFKESVSISLAIVANMQYLQQKFGHSMHCMKCN